MTDPFENPIFGERPDPATEVEGTGHTDVDAVVGSLSGLDELPVDEHVAVFERAHESLRRTLVGAGQEGHGDSVATGRN